MTPTVACAATTGAGVILFLVAEARRSRGLAWIGKPIASTGFVALACLSGATGSRHGIGILIALVLSWLGDLLLIPESTFLAGLGSFLLAHISFAASFALRGMDRMAAAAALTALALPAAIVWRWLSPHLPPAFRVPVAAYVVAITAMVAAAVATTWSRPAAPLILGVVAFYFSDISVARDRFVAPGLRNRLWGVPLYYGAQLLIAVSVSC
ncbi:MAG: lysoplasmalogenase [Acidobacteriota bacterium]